jgi:hypothetical protein
MKKNGRLWWSKSERSTLLLYQGKEVKREFTGGNKEAKRLDVEARSIANSIKERRAL